MTTKNSCVFTRCSPALVLLAFLAFNTTAQAQDSSDGSAAATSAVFTVEKTPNPGFNNFLFDISGDSENDIWAVGTFAQGALGLHFDGSHWKSVPMALPNTANMRGVSVLSSDDVWAVGSANSNTQDALSVVQHFDGNKWSVVPSPQFSSGAQLFAVKAISPSDVFAVGETHSDNQKPNPLVEHFDGTKWSVLPTPQFKGQTVSLRAIAGTSNTDIWVTGLVFAGPPVIMHFDGQQFRIVPFPASDKTASLGEVAAIAPDDAWVVGAASDTTTGLGETLTAHWDGKAWTVVPSPDLTKDDGLVAVAAISPTDVWAAGCAPCGADTGIGQVFLIEHWDGKRWTINPTPRIGKGEVPFSILAFPSGNVYVAGTASEAGGKLPFATLILHTAQGK